MDIKTIERELTRHADDLQLYANGIAEDALGELDATADRIYALIAQLYVKYRKSGLQPDAKTVKFINDLKRKIEEIRNAAWGEIEDDLAEASRDTAKTQSDFMALVFAALTGADVAYLTQKQLEAISRYGIYNGNTRKQILDRVSAGDADRIFDAMTNAVQMKLSLEEAAEAVKKEMEKTRRFVKTETDAVINGTANDANMAFAEKNKSYLIYCAVLDDKVCEHCASLDGEVYAHDDPELPFVPQHPNCRCSLWPVPEEYRNTEPVSFAEYIASLTPKEQKARLGKAKYDAWKRGEYTLRRYETPNVGQRLSIGEIRKRDEEALAKTKIDFDPHKIMTITSPATRKAVVCLRRYTCGEDGMYRTINSYMFAGPAAERNEYIEWIIDGIDSFMSVSTLAKDQFVYRGIRSPLLYNQLMGGQLEIPIKFYQSTSLSKEVASRYAGNVQGESVLTKILLHAGTNCVDVSKISTAPNPEEEILVNATGKLSYKSLYYNEKTKQLEGYAVYEK